MREGYQPTPAEMGLAQENFEAMNISERDTDHGKEEVDAQGRVVRRIETWDETQQITQISYPEIGGSVEDAKLLTGPEAGKEIRREHPGTSHEFGLQIHDTDLGNVSLSVVAKLETLGSTAGGAGDEVLQPWAHFEIDDPTVLTAFAKIPAERRLPNDRGEFYSILNGEFGGGQTIEVNGRTVTIESIGRLSVVFSDQGEPKRATLHKIIWKNSPAMKEA